MDQTQTLDDLANAAWNSASTAAPAAPKTLDDLATEAWSAEPTRPTQHSTQPDASGYFKNTSDVGNVQREMRSRATTPVQQAPRLESDIADRERIISDATRDVALRTLPFDQVVPILQKKYPGYQPQSEDAAMFDTFAKHFTGNRFAPSPLDRPSDAQMFQQALEKIPGSATRSVVSGAAKAGLGLAGLGAWASGNQEARQEAADMSASLSQGREAANNAAGAWLPRWATGGIETLSNALVTAGATGGFGGGGAQVGEAALTRMLGAGAAKFVAQTGTAGITMAAEATNDAGLTADRAGVTGVNKAAYMGASGLLALVTSRLAQKALGGAMSEGTAQILTPEGAKQLATELGHEAAALGFQNVGGLVAARLSGVQKEITFSDVAEAFAHTIRDAIGFKLVGHAQDLPEIAQTGSAKIAEWAIRNPETAADMASRDTLSRAEAKNAGLDELFNRGNVAERQQVLGILRKLAARGVDVQQSADKSIRPDSLPDVPELPTENGLSKDQVDAELQKVEDSTPNRTTKPDTEFDLPPVQPDNRDQRRADLEAGMQGTPQRDPFATQYMPPAEGNLFGIPAAELKSNDWKGEANQRLDELNGQTAPDKSAIGQQRIDYSGVQRVLDMRGDLPGDGMPTRREVSERLNVSREQAGHMIRQAKFEDIVQQLQTRGESEPRARELAEWIRKGVASLGQPGERTANQLELLSAIPIPQEQAAKELAAAFTKGRRKGASVNAAANGAVDAVVQAHGGGSERRQDATQRKRVDQMSPEELRREILTSEKTGLPNQRAFDDAQAKSPKLIAQTDVEGLKWINDNIGDDAGDALLKAKAQAMREAGIDAYHAEGDTFLARFDSPEQARQKMANLEKRLNGAIVDVVRDGEVVARYKGFGFAYGLGNDRVESHEAMKADKAGRVERGERSARGGRPARMVEVTSEGRPTAGDVASVGRLAGQRSVYPGADAQGNEQSAGGSDVRSAEGLNHGSNNRNATQGVGLGKEVPAADSAAAETEQRGNDAASVNESAKTKVKVAKGDDVLFRPKLGSKERLGRVVGVNSDGSLTLTTGGNQYVTKKYRRLQADQNAEELSSQRSEYQPEEKQHIIAAAKDARLLARNLHGIELDHIMTESASKGRYKQQIAANVEGQKLRDKLISRLGLTDYSEKGQADALPKLLEEHIAKLGEVPPELKTVDTASNVGPGDTITLAGKKWSVQAGESGNRLRLVNPDLGEIRVPDTAVPKDRGTKPEGATRGTPIDELPPFGSSPKRDAVGVDTDLLGQQHAVLKGPSGRGEQQNMFDNELTPDLQRERKLKDQHKAEGGGELFGEQARIGEAKTTLPEEGTQNKTTISNHEIIAKASRAFDVPVKVDYVRRAKALGIYNNFEHIVRLRGEEQGNLYVASHEIGHHIDNLNDISNQLPANLKNELGPLDYDKEKKRPHEGFAEYIAGKLDGEDVAKLAPRFTEYFDNYLKQHPELSRKLDDFRKDIAQWQNAGAVARARATTSETGVTDFRTTGEKIKDATYAVKKATLDRFIGVQNFADELNAQRKAKGLQQLPAHQDPNVIIRALGRGASAMAENAIEHGVFNPITGERYKDANGKAIPSLTESLSQFTPETLDGLKNFLRARHSLDVLRTGRNPGMAFQDAKTIYEKYKDKPEVVKAADAIVQYRKATVRVLQDAGGLSGEAANAILESYPNAVPLKRAQDAKENRLANALRSMTPLKRMSMKGSDRAVIDPLASIIQETHQIYQAANEITVRKAIYKAATSVEGMGGWVSEVKAPPEFIKTSIENIRRELEKAGADLSDADTEALITFVRAGKIPAGQDKVFPLIVDGETKYIQLHPELADAISTMQPMQLPWMAEMALGKAAALKRAGATGYRAGFGIANAVRDFFTGAMQTKDNAASFMLHTIGNYYRVNASKIAEAFGGKPDAVLALYKQWGGETAQYLGGDVKSAFEQIQDAVNTKRSAYNIVTSPKELAAAIKGAPGGAVHLLHEFLSSIETAPRLAEFENRLQAAGFSRREVEAGSTVPAKHLYGALLDSKQVTTNFDQAGTIMRAWNRIEAFSNAKIQGYYQPLQRFKEDPTKFAIRGAAMLAAPTIAYWMMNKDKDWYKELPAWQRFGFWNFDAGNGKVVRIPRPFEIGSVFSALPEAMLNYATEKDPKRAAQLADQMLPDRYDFADRLLPDAIQPALEVLFNYDLFRKKKIVGDELAANKLPQDQYYDYNTSFSQYMGKLLSVSPAKLDYLLSSYTGGLGTDVARIPDEGPAKALSFGRFERTTAKGESIDEFYAKRDDVAQQYGSEKAKVGDAKNVSPELSMQHHTLQHIASLMTQVNDYAKTIADKDAQREVQRYNTGLSRLALGKPDSDEYPNLFSAKRLPPELASARDKFIAQQAGAVAQEMPMKLTKEQLVKGETIEQKRADWERTTKTANALLKLAGVTPQAAQDALATSMRKRLYSRDAIKRNLAHLAQNFTLDKSAR